MKCYPPVLVLLAVLLVGCQKPAIGGTWKLSGQGRDCGTITFTEPDQVVGEYNVMGAAGPIRYVGTYHISMNGERLTIKTTDLALTDPDTLAQIDESRKGKWLEGLDGALSGKMVWQGKDHFFTMELNGRPIADFVRVK
jgi:hypothetical protein